MTTKEFLVQHLKTGILICQGQSELDPPTMEDLEVLGQLHKILEDYC